jgi:PAS domain S-box-containing protein
MNQEQIDILQGALKREKTARKAAEKILEDKSRELYTLSEELKVTNAKLEDLVNEKSSQLAGIFENIIDAYLVIDLSGNALKMNDAATDLFGYDITEETLNITNLIYPEDATYAFESFSELIEKGSFSNYTARILRKNKEVRWVHINASLIYDKNKKAIAAQGIIRDITETKRTSELIEEQKKELDVIVQNSSLGIVLTQFGSIIRTNKAFQKLLGYTEEEFSKFTVKDITFAEDLPASKYYTDQMNSGAIDNFVINKRYKRKNGSVLWAKTNVNPVRDNFNEIQYQVALIEDITLEREQTLIIDMINELAKSILGKYDIYEIAWEMTQKIAEYLGTDDCIIYLVNHQSQTLEQIASFGAKVGSKKEVINKIVLPIGKGIVGHVAQSGKPEIISDSSKDKRYIVDDQKRFSEISVPIISEGKVIGVIDSEHLGKNFFRKEHLHALENIASLVSMQFKSALNIRKREKAETKNIQLLDKLEKSNNELNEYAHIVSHDLKSPLRSIDALISWIKMDNEGKLDDPTVQNLKLIGDTLETMERLISNILEYSSAGSDTNESQEVDLNETMDDLKKLLFVPDHISINIVKKLPVLKGDPTKFQQLFQNLLSNAIKFSNKDNGIVEIDFMEKPSFYQFSVKDNGIGIEKKFHNRIFKIFQSLNKSKESTGIGLSIVKKIVVLYEGTVWLESEPGEGATFFFTIKK